MRTAVSEQDISKAMSTAKRVLGNVSNPRIQKLLADGLIFSAGGATSQAVIQTYAPILAELGVDFVLEHMNDTEDKAARELAHKILRDVVGHGVKLGITEAVIASSEEERKETVSRFEMLRDVMKMASAQKIDLEEALKRVGKEIKGVEIVKSTENTP